MNPVQSFDPIANPIGMIDTHGINKGEQLLLFNSSLACLQLEFADHTKDILPPSWCRDWIKASPMSLIKYTTLFTLPIEGQPISQVYGTLYEPGEHVQSVNASLQYVYVIGNPGGLSLAGSTLVNTTNPPNTSIILIQPSDVSGTNYSILATNSGDFLIQTDNAGVLTQLFKIVSGASPSIQLGDPNKPVVTELLGGLQTDTIEPFSGDSLQLKSQSGTGQIVLRDTSPEVSITNDIAIGNKFSSDGALFISDGLGNIALATLIAGSNSQFASLGNETHVNNLKGADIAFYTGVPPAALVQIGRITNAGSIIPGNGTMGSFSALKKVGPFNLTTTSTAFNHGLSVVPDGVFLQIHGTTSSGSGIIVKVDFGSFTATTFNAVASAAVTVYALVYKA
jgi:hypothetical protein